MKQLTTIVFLLTLTSAFGQSNKLQQQRFDILVTKYLDQPMEREALAAIISSADTNINIDNAYQLIMNEDKTKFVSFFLEQFNAQNFKAFSDSKKDKSITILTNEDIMKEGDLDEVNTYGYIVYGVKYNEKWYYEKNEVTYFAAASLNEGKQVYFNNLQKWDFFIKKSTEINPNFWSTLLFEKVPQSAASDTYWSPYIGVYEVVAKQMIKEKEEISRKKELAIVDQYVRPLADKLKIQNNYENITIKHMSREYLLVYPPDMHVILCPIKVKEVDKEMFIRYFVLIPQDNSYKVYEWNYLNPNNFKNTQFGPSFIDQINTLTVWNYTYHQLDDNKFWNEYVLLKSGDTYKYLQEVN